MEIGEDMAAEGALGVEGSEAVVLGDEDAGEQRSDWLILSLARRSQTWIPVWHYLEIVKAQIYQDSSEAKMVKRRRHTESEPITTQTYTQKDVKDSPKSPSHQLRGDSLDAENRRLDFRFALR